MVFQGPGEKKSQERVRLGYGGSWGPMPAIQGPRCRYLQQPASLFVNWIGGLQDFVLLSFPTEPRATNLTHQSRLPWPPERRLFLRPRRVRLAPTAPPTAHATNEPKPTARPTARALLEEAPELILHVVRVLLARGEARLGEARGGERSWCFLGSNKGKPIEPSKFQLKNGL